ncbi:hypothetical protein EV360DRAFT_85633 [Lentinula raphanica]|nr:hypothetical protein EV360DRAFT_85633 [Lentinula raphanica]
MSFNAAEIQIQVNWNHYVELMEFAFGFKVILVYDYLLTLDLEIERFWKRDTKRLASVLFFVNRYLSLVGNIPLMLFFFWPEPILRYHNASTLPYVSLRCPLTLSSFFVGISGFLPFRREALDFYAQIVIALVQCNICVLFVLRTNAIYSGSKRITGFLCAILAAVAVNDVVQLYYADKTDPDAVDPPSAVSQVGAVPSFSNSQGLHFAYLWIGIFVFDLCVFSLTLWKTYYIYKDGYISGGIGTIVMRDGLMYFGIITLATLANIIVFLFGGELTRGLFPIFTSIVMMSRLMLNLREDHSHETQMSGLVFANYQPGCSPHVQDFEVSRDESARTSGQ